MRFDTKKGDSDGEKGDIGKGVRSICTVSGANHWLPVGSGKITVDSAAEESVCPTSWGDACQMRRPSRWLIL